LVGEGLDERDVFLGEPLRFAVDENDDADEVVLNRDRDRNQRSVVLRRSAVGVFRVVTDVRDVDGLTCDRRPTGAGRSVESMRVLSVVLSALPVVGDHV
jgi:hypothetical protein